MQSKEAIMDAVPNQPTTDLDFDLDLRVALWRTDQEVVRAGDCPTPPFNSCQGWTDASGGCEDTCATAGCGCPDTDGVSDCRACTYEDSVCRCPAR